MAIKRTASSVGRLILLVLLLCPLLLCAAPACAEPRTVRVGIYENAPKVFTESGKPAGIFVDIVEEIARAEGWQLRYVGGNWAQGLERLEKGEIDLMPDVAYTAEREKIFNFHKIPVLSLWSQVYAKKGSGIQSILDLNGKRVAGLEQTIQLETFRRLAKGFELDITLVPVADYQTEFRMIAEGKVDAGVTNRLYGLMYARKSGLEDTPVMFDPAPFFFAARKEAPAELVEAIDRRLDALKKDPQSAYYAAMKRWTSEKAPLAIPAWLEVAGLVLGIAFVLTLVGAFALKKQVRARTLALRRANDELLKGEQKYRHLFEQNPVPMFIYQRGALNLLAVNDAFLVNYGYSRDEALKLNLADLYPEQEKENVAAFAQGLKGLAYTGEWHHVKADRTVFPIIVRSHDIEYWGYDARIAVIADVSEMKRLEAELRHINEYLDQKVRERTLELEAKNAELEQANGKLKDLDRLKSMFIASMSHELRTPLNSIIGFTGILLQELAGPMNEEQKKQLGMVKGSSQHLLELITDLIDLSKIEAGKITVSMELFDLARAAREIAATFQVAADRKALALTVTGPQSLEVKGDARRLKQVLVNLIGNAVKFTESGEVRIELRHEPGETAVAVSDSGPGIRERDMEKLFRDFSQITSPDLPKHEGTGLGLYISKKLMHLMGGTISARSEFGKGSEFTLHLPSHPADAADGGSGLAGHPAAAT